VTGSDFLTNTTTFEMQAAKTVMTHTGNFRNVLLKSWLRIQPHPEVTHLIDELDGVRTLSAQPFMLCKTRGDRRREDCRNRRRNRRADPKFEQSSTLNFLFLRSCLFVAASVFSSACLVLTLVHNRKFGYRLLLISKYQQLSNIMCNCLL
jgi:hypothetical protein